MERAIEFSDPSIINSWVELKYLNLSLIGISLRKVEKGQQQSEKCRMDEGLHDVASILARRVAMEFSDSDSGSESGSGSDWDDETSA